MTENQILNSVKNYIEGHGCKVTRLYPETSSPDKKSPDFEVLFGKKQKFYCEVKSPLLLVNKNTNMFHWTTSVTKLRGLIHKAVSQFIDQDSKHKNPWILVFTSDHMQLNWTSMTHAISGKVFYGKDVIVDLNHLRRVKDTFEDVQKIDAFIWMQMNQSLEIIQVRIAITQNTNFPKLIKDIAKIFAPQKGDKSLNK